MAKIDLDHLNQEYFDVLREIGNIGTGNATTALAKMLNCKVDMYVPQVKLLEFSEVGNVIGGEELLMVGIYLGVQGEISGSILFMLEIGSAQKLIQLLLGCDSDNGHLSEMEESALKEIGNIISASYLNSLSTLTGLSIYPTVPALSVDMAGAILSVPAIVYGTMADKLLMIQTQFFDGLNGYFILAPDLESYEKILSSLGM